MINYLEILKKNSLFTDFNDDEILTLLYSINAKIALYEKNEYILHINDDIDKFGILIEGQLNVQRIDYEGNLNIISNLKPSQLFAEAFVYADIKKMPVNVFCITQCKVIFIKKDSIESLFDNDIHLYRKISNNILKDMSKKLFSLNRKVEILTKQNIREKVLAYLNSIYEVTNKNIIEVPFNREQLADFLCVNRSALSRELSKMKDEGIIDFHKNAFKIL